MARIARKDYETCYFHVIVQGFEKQCVFLERYLKEKYYQLLCTEMENYKVEILSYCIMDNHAHLLIYCDTIEQMSLFMQKVNTAFATFYNKEKGRVGYVFRDRYLSEPIMSQKYLFSCIAYIHFNPVVAKMVPKPENYPYSSYCDFINKKGIVTDSVLLKLFEITQDYLPLFHFIHFENGIGMEYKRDLPKLRYYEAKRVIHDILNGCCITNLKNERYDIQKHFFQLFTELGVGVYCIEKELGIDHRKVKRILSLPI